MQRLTRAVLIVAAAVSAILTISATPSAADDPTWEAVVPGEYIIELKPDGTAAVVAAAAGALRPPELLAATSRYVRLVLDPLADPTATVAALLNIAGVERAQPNFVSGSSDYLGTKRRFFGDLDVAQVTASSTEYRVAQPGLGNAGLPAGSTASGITVAVLDTGVDTAHPKLAGRIAAGGYDFIDRDTNAAEVANGLDDNGNSFIDEAHGHGTYVAGLVTLVAPGSKVLPVRVLNSDGAGTTWTTMKGLAWASARGAKVINLSLGGQDTGPVSEEQLRNLESSGIVIVAAAGNDATSALTYPAGNDGVLGVTSINGRTGAAATFANSGSWIDVAAPGVAIVSLYPGGRFASWGGSSASAPIVAAAMAMIAAQSPGGHADDIVAKLTGTARHGQTSGLSAYGNVDVGAAVRRAQGL